MIALLVGDCSPANLEAIRPAVEGDATVAVCKDVEAAKAALADTSKAAPLCVFLEADAPHAAPFVAWMRETPHLFWTPLILVVAPWDEAAFERAYAIGADDVISVVDAEGARQRLESLERSRADVRPPVTEGLAIVAHSNQGRRQVLGRALRQAGFDVAFAADCGEALAMANKRTECSLLALASPLIRTDADMSVDSLVMRSVPSRRVPVIVLASDPDEWMVDPDSRTDGMVALSNEHAPPQDLVFLANELRRQELRELRGAPRVLHSALCLFRGAGQLRRVHGVTYNLSRDGMYVRTMIAPAAGDTVWIELRPPGTEDAVHLRGRTVWSRRYGDAGGAPPGFGVRLLHDQCPPSDLEAYVQGYEMISASTWRRPIRRRH
jgi:CheY-like chemotaxis protein